MPLNLTVFNQFYAINKICGQEKQRHYLESLGFVPVPGFRFCRSFTVIISSW